MITLRNVLRSRFVKIIFKGSVLTAMAFDLKKLSVNSIKLLRKIRVYFNTTMPTFHRQHIYICKSIGIGNNCTLIISRFSKSKISQLAIDSVVSFLEMIIIAIILILCWKLLNIFSWRNCFKRLTKNLMSIGDEELYSSSEIINDIDSEDETDESVFLNTAYGPPSYTEYTRYLSRAEYDLENTDPE